MRFLPYSQLSALILSRPWKGVQQDKSLLIHSSQDTTYVYTAVANCSSQESHTCTMQTVQLCVYPSLVPARQSFKKNKSNIQNSSSFLKFSCQNTRDNILKSKIAFQVRGKRRLARHVTTRTYSPGAQLSYVCCTETKKKNRNNTITGRERHLSSPTALSVEQRQNRAAFQTRLKSLCSWIHRKWAFHTIFKSVQLYSSNITTGRFSVWSAFPRHRCNTEKAEA